MPLTARRRGLMMGALAGWIAERTEREELGGTIVGAAHGVGHLIRENWKARPGQPRRSCDVVIVGGGVAGLSAAWRLAEFGLDVQLFELEPAIGGTSRAGYDGATAHPFGAHYLPIPNPRATPTLRLLEQMGVLTGFDAGGRATYDGRALCHAPDERVFFGGRWHAGLVPEAAMTPADRVQMERFSQRIGELSLETGSDGLRAFDIPLDRSSRDRRFLELDELSMDRWLTQEGFDSPIVRWFVEYATRDDFGANLISTSAWAGLHYFCSRGTSIERTDYLVWPEGNGRLIEELARRSTATIDKSSLALRVEPGAAGGATVTIFDVSSQSVTEWRARHVILATPAFVANRILIGAEREAPRRESSPWMVANLHVTRPIDPNAAWDSIVFGSEGLGYVDASHQLSPPRERTVLTYYRAYGEPDVAVRRQKLLSRSWQQLVGDVLLDLMAPHPSLVDQTQRIDIALWGHAMPRPVPGFLSVPSAVELHPAVSFSHADLRGMGLFEESQRAGVLAAERALSSLDLSFESWT